MAGKKDAALRKALKEYSKETAKEIADEQLEGGLPEDENDKSLNDVIRFLSSTLPDDKSVYIKLYKVHPLPTEYQKEGPLFLTTIKDVSSINDLEEEIQRIVARNGWLSGVYQLKFFRSDRKGPQLKHSLSIYAPEEAPEEEGFLAPANNVVGFKYPSAPQPAKDPHKEASSIIGMVKELKGIADDGKGRETDPALMPLMLSSITDSFTKGLEVAGSGNKSGGMGEFSQMLNVLEKMNIINTAPPKAEKSMIEQLIELNTLAESLGVKGSGDQKPMTLFISAIAPQIPQMISSIIDPLSKLIDLYKLKTQGQIAAAGIQPPGGHLIGGVANTPLAAPLPPLTAVPEVNAQEARMTAKIEMFIEDLKDMVTSGNKDFETMLNGINYTFGKSVMKQYQVGTIHKAQIVGILQQKDELFKTSEGDAFLNEFFEWVDGLFKPRKYKCDKCGRNEELSESEFKEDSSCSDCDEGILKLVEEEEPGPSDNGNEGKLPEDKPVVPMTG